MPVEHTAAFTTLHIDLSTLINQHLPHFGTGTSMEQAKTAFCVTMVNIEAGSGDDMLDHCQVQG